jgi:hypothetical protein
MTFTLKDLKHLEIMAELQENPVILPEAPVVEPVAELSLTEKLLTLASKLRTAGYVHQAENLENRFGTYKKAEVDANLLYRAHSETGDELLESAHPDGDVEMAPAQDNNGDVETGPSQHKKILKVVLKSAQLAGTIKNIVIAQKFQALADALNNKIISNKGDATSPDKKKSSVYLYMVRLHDMAKRIVENFNNPDESQRITAFSVLKQLIIGPQFRIDSIEDVDAYIDSIMQMVNSTPSTKKAEIVSMLKKTLNVKISQTVGINDSDKPKKSFEEFKNIVKEITDTLEPQLMALFSNPKYEVMLDSGKPMIKWKEEINISLDRLKNSVGQYNNYVQNNTINDKSAATIWPKDFLDRVRGLADDMQKSINTEKNFKIQDPSSKQKGLDNVKFPNALKSRVNSLYHLWYAFWAKYGEGKKEDLDYHNKFLTPNKILSFFTPEKEKLTSIKSFISNLFLQSNEVKSSPDILAYINGMVGFMNDIEKNFQSIIDKANAHMSGNHGAFGAPDEITMEVLKSFITDQTLLSKGNFNSPESFIESLNGIIKTIMNKLNQLVVSNPVFAKNKDEIISALSDREQVLFGQKK